MELAANMFSFSCFKRWAMQLACVGAIWVCIVPAQASSLTPADSRAVRGVVEAQLAAFAKDDAVKAFSFAAPNVRETFGTATNFMSMVRSGYPVVYRPASVTFLTAQLRDKQVVQRVQMNDADGEAWLAVYTLEKQKNKVWRITGCLVVENKGSVA